MSGIYTLGLGFRQQVLETGGEVSIGTEISRFDDFRTKNVRYNGTPIYFKYSQPLFGFNKMKWDKKIELLKNEESKKDKVQEIENIREESTLLFFDALQAQIDIEIANYNYQNTLRLLDIENGKIKLGTTSYDKILQINLNITNYKKEFDISKYKYNNAMAKLKNFIGLADSELIKLKVPNIPSSFVVDTALAFKLAKENRSEFLAFEIKRVESQMNTISETKKNIAFSLSGGFGVNRAGNTIASIYNNPNQQQNFSIGFSLPILDWKRKKIAIKKAHEEELLVNYQNRMEENSIREEIRAIINVFDFLKVSIDYSILADSIANERFQLTKVLYQSGKVSLTELFIAQNEKDTYKKNYINTIKEYWMTIFLIRRVTLYDFLKESYIRN
ncbi:MAG: TolC family protein [Sediminibacterium sp.]|nr:TolC family protein [Sediminibacterium sp.]